MAVEQGQTLEQLAAAGWKPAPSMPPPAPPAVLPDVSKHAGVPVAGRGTQFDPEQAQRGAKSAYDTATTPLAHPTGVDAIDGFTSPVGLASLVAGGAGIVRAGMTGGATAAAKTALADAAPMVKYEATKALLMRLGVPQSMASVAAAAVSGIKKGAKEAPVAAPHAPTAEGYSRYQPNVSGYQPEATPAAAAPASPGAAGPVAPGPPAAPAIPAASPPPPAAASPAPTMPAVQTMRNLSPATEAAVKLTAAETSEFLRLQKQGKSMKEAFDLIAAQRAFAQRFGLPTAGDVRNAVVDRNMSGKWPE